MEINTNGIPDFLENTQANQLNPAHKSPTNQADASLKIDYASLIEKAEKTPEAQDKKIQDARELLINGQLESSENIVSAAENIINFGI